MKNIVLAIALFISSVGLVRAQGDPCSEITKEHDDELGKTRYETPINNNLTIARSVKDNGAYNNLTLNFWGMKNIANYNASGLFVTFDDGTIFKDLGANISCSYQNGRYRYDGVKLLDDRAEFLPFKTKKIVKIRIYDIEIPIDDALAIKFKAWANCIETIK
jgi:hypothetical protein